MTKKAVVIRGDGTGPELISCTMKIIDSVSPNNIEFIECDAGADYWEREQGQSLIPPDTLSLLEDSDACLKGPTVTPTIPGAPRSVAVTLRQKFDLYANVRPIKSLSNDNSNSIEMLCIREGTEGMYSGLGFQIDKDTAITIRKITRPSCTRIAKFAFQSASDRNWKTVVPIHKANILRETDDIFLDEVNKISDEYPDIDVEDYFIDNMAQQLYKNPERFHNKVLLSTNLFMDIISEEASALIGSIGNVYSANIGDNYAMFEPAHGSSPKYKGQDKVNPTATVLSAAWMLQYLGDEKAGNDIFNATEKVISEGKCVTYDLGGNSKTSEMTSEIIKYL
ncbi:MAG: isocitrate/isopropylmalate dehydrogenase family protein [Nitrososphaerales archaeon]|nr:isocitrate/isopropylmalate dehydrogenase family protein [Nitrososphaerales archaeon]